VFKRFLNLHALRLHPSDRAGTYNHLGGWLRPGDAEVFNKAWETETLGREGFEGDMYGDQRKTTHTCPLILDSVFRDAKSAGTIIQELRISYGCGILAKRFTDVQQGYGMFSNVREL
jgi:hypothetical protein